MTPFNPTALLAMLLAFYPTVSPENLVRARRERPEYFAGGTLIGRWPEVLLLPDGREWDLIFSVSEPARRRWQVIPAGGGGGGDEFPLEPGPLTPIDVPPDMDPELRREFEALVADATIQLGPADDVLAHAESEMAGAASSAALDADYGEHVEQAEGEVAAQERTWTDLDAGELLIASDEMEHLAESHEGDVPEPTTLPPLPNMPDTGDAPPPEDLPQPIPDPGDMPGGPE